MDLKKLDCTTFFLLLMTFSSIFLGNIQFYQLIKENESVNKTEIEPSPAAYRANIGAWILVAGDRSDHDIIELMKSGCDIAYFILASRDVDPSDIKYLGPDYGTPGIFQDDYAYRENIQDAIINWAASRVSSTKGLGIYLLDHGGTNKMCIPGPDLSDSDLNSWLDTLETNTGCKRVYIIYEACSAGSFINPVSKDNRIVITSTDATHGAAGLPDLSWAYFSEKFFSSIVQCKTIGECFEDAYAYVQANGLDQYPWIDDNHDETGNYVNVWGNLPNGGDGNDALNVWIGTGANCPISTIQFYPLKFFVKYEAISASVWAVVKNNNSGIEKVYVRVTPEDWTPPEAESDGEGEKMVVPTDILTQELTDPDGDGNFTGLLYINRYRDFWDKKGDYKISFHARGKDGTVADLKSTEVVLNDDGEAPSDTSAPTISIVTPSQNAYLQGVISINTTGNDDQALDKIQIFLDGTLLKEETMPPYYPYPQATCSLNASEYSKGRHNITAVAIDKSNNINSTSVFVNFMDQIIPGYEIAPLFIGTLLGIILIINYLCKKGLRRIKIES